MTQMQGVSEKYRGRNTKNVKDLKVGESCFIGCHGISLDDNHQAWLFTNYIYDDATRDFKSKYHVKITKVKEDAFKLTIKKESLAKFRYLSDSHNILTDNHFPIVEIEEI